MIIYFGLELDELVYPKSSHTEGGTHYLGTQNLLFFLESHLGLIGHPTNNEYLRIEQYRQALLAFLEIYDPENAFFAASFDADQFAAAATLLKRRDELLLAGWNFEVQDNTPKRLQTLAAIEQIIQAPEKDDQSASKYELAWGYADRFVEVLNKLASRQHPITSILLNEPLADLPPHFQRLFAIFKSQNIPIEELDFSIKKDGSDLAKFQKSITQKTAKQKLSGDGSLLVLKSKRETEAAVYLAKIFRQNKDYQPVCLIPEKNRALDNALIQEGLPSLGILSASLARPSLQILKLIPTFLWHPIDPYKILEFVSLTIKPLHDGLAKRIAEQMAQTPGINSDNWHAMIGRYFAEIEARAALETSNIDVDKVKSQYRFWFERTRYDVSGTVPKDDVIELFKYLALWAKSEFDDNNNNTSLLVLRGQAQRVQDLLETLPESQTALTALELERIVRTIYEPSPVVFKEQQVGHFPYVHDPSAIIKPVDKMLWWNFIHNEQDHFFSNWYTPEIAYFEALNIHLQSPQHRNKLALWQRKRPILHAQQQLILIIPEMVDGSSVQPHPLNGDLHAAFDNPEAIVFDIATEKGRKLFEQYFKLPTKKTLTHRKLGSPPAFVQVNASDLADRDYETFTSLESLFYYPYQWVFKYKLKLIKSSILSIVADTTLMGNLAHRFFELLFKEDIHEWNKQQVETWIDEKAPRLFAREGAVLLMYGREPERQAFLNRIKYAAWSLVSMIQSNGWTVVKTEMSLQGAYAGKELRAKADLVLEKEGNYAVVDLKWRGAAYRQRIIRNHEDLQLVMYSKLLINDQTWANTAYFIIENGKMIARNNNAFKEAISVLPDNDNMEINHLVWERMSKTYDWRHAQLKEGKVEIRTESTLLDLEDAYAEDGDMFNRLEMKDKNASFDDYQTLINLIE